MTALLADGTSERAETGRLLVVDVIRGAAVLLMLLDHVLAVTWADSPLRYGSPLMVTRLSLPLFMLAAAAVWAPGKLSRRWRLVPVAVVETFLGAYLGLDVVGIVAVFGLSLVVLECAARLRLDLDRPFVPATVAILFTLYAPVPAWPGYQLSLVLAWFLLGRCYWASVWAFSVPAWSRPLEVVGRHPLAWYVGHLVVLAALVALL